jgi:spore germination protein YaaH
MKAFPAAQKTSNRSHRSLIAALTSLLLLLPLTTIGFIPRADGANPPRKILSGWIPYYSMKTSLPAALNNADLIREVMPFWYTLKHNSKNNKTTISDLYSPANPSVPIARPLEAMRNAGYLIIPTITDGTAKLVLSNLLANPQSRTTIATTIANFVIANNYDGIDLDFEGFAFVDGSSSWAKTQPLWVEFIKEISALLRAENKLLSIATPYAYDPTERQKGYTVYAWAKVAPYIDRLRIMTYDYSVAKPGPIGPITWAEKTIKYAVSIMPASKVYVGLPGYGRDWVTKVEGKCPAALSKVIKPGARAATFVMRDAAGLASGYGVTPTFNDQFGEATFSYTKVYKDNLTSCTASRTAWYQNAQSYSLRSALVGKYKLGGVVAWTLGMEEPLAMESIRLVASSIAPSKVLSVLTSNVADVSYGNAIQVSGRFELDDKSLLPGIPVRLEAKNIGETTWRTISTLTTSPTGSVAIPLLLSKPAALRLFSEGTWERSQSISKEILVNINRTVSFIAPTSVKNGTSFAISGTVRPRSAGISVALLKFDPSGFKKVGLSELTDDQGVFTFEIEGEPRGVARYIVIIEGDSTWKTLTPPAFSIIVR